MNPHARVSLLLFAFAAAGAGYAFILKMALTYLKHQTQISDPDR